jgi:hypothetical protein
MITVDDLTDLRDVVRLSALFAISNERYGLGLTYNAFKQIKNRDLDFTKKEHDPIAKGLVDIRKIIQDYLKSNEFISPDVLNESLGGVLKISGLIRRAQNKYGMELPYNTFKVVRHRKGPLTEEEDKALMNTLQDLVVQIDNILGPWDQLVAREIPA